MTEDCSSENSAAKFGDCIEGTRASIDQTSSSSLQDLRLLLNQHVPIIKKELSSIEKVQEESVERFKEAIRNLSGVIEQLIIENSATSEDLESKIKQIIVAGELFDKKTLKNAVKDLIGNKLNVGISTETNHDFKITMIDNLKTLSRQLPKILIEMKVEEAKRSHVALPREQRRHQTEEWLLMGQGEKAREMLQKDFDSLKSEDNLVDFISFLLRTQNFEQCQLLTEQLLTLEETCTFGYYSLAYLWIESENLDVAFLALKIAINLEPENKELWIILLMLYDKVGDCEQAESCELIIEDTSFTPDRFDVFESYVFPELKTEDDLANILNRQIKLGLKKFAAITKEYMTSRAIEFQNKADEQYLNIVEFGNDAVPLETMESNEENETFRKIVKSNLLYECDNQWRAVCGYENAFNLCLEAEQNFPRALAVHCGDWYLNEIRNTTKAYRFFEYCNEISATFKSLMGLGQVSFQEGKFEAAEGFFKEANKIDCKSGDNWLHLALVSLRLNKQQKSEKCYQISQKYSVQSQELLEEVEVALDI